jgi:hypothetical protein
MSIKIKGRHSMDMYIFYVYAYLRKKDLSPYYIGKGKDNRAYNGKHSVTIPKDKNKIVMLKEALSEKEALLIEIDLIKQYGRKDLGTGILHNRTDGGEGVIGAIVSEERKQQISDYWKGKPKPWASRPGESNTFYGKKHSEDTLKHFSEVKQGEKNPMFGRKQNRVCCIHCQREASVNTLAIHHKH